MGELLLAIIVMSFLWYMMTGGFRSHLKTDQHHGNWSCPRCGHLMPVERSMCNSCGYFGGPAA